MKAALVISDNLAAWMNATPELDTFKKVSARSGVGFGTVQRAKNGDGNITVEKLEAIAGAFGRTPADLLTPLAGQAPDNPSMDTARIISRNLAAWMAATPELDTLQRVEAKSGVGFGTIRRARNGDGNITIEKLTAIAAAFGRKPADLLTPPVDPEPGGKHPIVEETPSPVSTQEGFLRSDVRRNIAAEPARPDAFTGHWSAILWQPDITGVQTFAIGVLVTGNDKPGYRVMDTPGRLASFYSNPQQIQDIAWLLGLLRESLADLPPGGEVRLPALNLTLTPPRFVSGGSAQAVADDLFATLVPAARSIGNAKQSTRRGSKPC